MANSVKILFEITHPDGGYFAIIGNEAIIKFLSYDGAGALLGSEELVLAGLIDETALAGIMARMNTFLRFALLELV